MPGSGLARHWRGVVAGTVVVATAGVASWLVANAGAASAGTLSGALYRSPTSAAISWVNANPNDPRAAAIRNRITSQPTARWFTSANAGAIAGEVSAYVDSAGSAGQVAQLIPYAIPNRDCGGASAGGAGDLGSYQSWIQAFAKGLGARSAIVLLEPDSLALQTCLSATQVTERDNALATAVRTIKQADPAAKVYLDAGHSNWNPADVAAARLVAAGVKQADGFYTNLSNFRLTANEVAFGKAVLGALNDPRLHQVIDTSRNGAGPKGSEWCDPVGRLVGAAPTTSTGEATVDAFLWAKPPGEADGCRAGAGQFVPDLAFELAGGANGGGGNGGGGTGPTTKPPTTAPVKTTAPATDPTTAPPITDLPAGGAGCSVSYQVESQWPTGFIGKLTITNRGKSNVDGWTLTYAFPGTQRTAGMWNGTYTQDGVQVTVHNAGYNPRIAPAGSVTVGFQASFTGTNPAAIRFALNGVACSAG